MERYDAIVLGAGGIGSAALYHLARRGVRVIGIDRFNPPHDRGSTHGQTRVIRQAYFEHPDYVPLLLESYRLWHDLRSSVGPATVSSNRPGRSWAGRRHRRARRAASSRPNIGLVGRIADGAANRAALARASRDRRSGRRFRTSGRLLARRGLRARRISMRPELPVQSCSPTPKCWTWTANEQRSSRAYRAAAKSRPIG